MAEERDEQSEYGFTTAVFVFDHTARKLSPDEAEREFGDTAKENFWRMWPTVLRAIDFVVSRQTARGEIGWLVGADGSTTDEATFSSRGRRSARATTNSRDDSANATVVTSVSVLKATIPVPRTRSRSRLARSSGVSCSSSAASRSAGSASSRSSPLPASYSHSDWAMDVPDAERRKTTRCPSGLTTKPRGSPALKLLVRAARRGKESGDMPTVFAAPVPAARPVRR